MTIPKPGQYVKSIFKNGLIIEGFVENWGVKECTLKSENDDLLIITNPSEIIVIKIQVKPKEETKPGDSVKQSKLDKIKDEFEDVVKQPSSLDRMKKLADLRVLSNQAEKEIITGKLKSHEITDVKPVNYGLPNPNFVKKVNYGLPNSKQIEVLKQYSK